MDNLNIPWEIISICNGNDFVKSTRDGVTVSYTPSLVSDSKQQFTLPIETGVNGIGNLGALIQPYWKLTGRVAFTIDPVGARSIYGNERHFNDLSREQMNLDVKALILSAIRQHIKPNISECNVYLTLSVARREYIIDHNTNTCPFADRLSESLTGGHRVQFQDGNPVNINIKKVIIKPQAELATYALFIPPGRPRPQYDMLYYNYEQIQQEQNDVRKRQLKNDNAKTLVVFDIGGLSTQLETIKSVNGIIQVTDPASPNDLGMKNHIEPFKSEIGTLIGTQKVNCMSDYELMKLFVSEDWKGVSLKEAVDSVLSNAAKQYWNEFDTKMRKSYHQVSTVILSGQSWKKDTLRKAFLTKLEQKAEEFHFEIFANPEKTGEYPVIGGWSLMEKWLKKNRGAINGYPKR